MDVDPNEELIRLRAQVAELQSERQAIQESESSRSKKARTSVSTELVPSVVRSNLIEAADTALRDVGRGVLRVGVCGEVFGMGCGVSVLARRHTQDLRAQS